FLSYQRNCSFVFFFSAVSTFCGDVISVYSRRTLITFISSVPFVVFVFGVHQHFSPTVKDGNLEVGNVGSVYIPVVVYVISIRRECIGYPEIFMYPHTQALLRSVHTSPLVGYIQVNDVIARCMIVIRRFKYVCRIACAKGPLVSVSTGGSIGKLKHTFW